MYEALTNYNAAQTYAYLPDNIFTNPRNLGIFRGKTSDKGGGVGWGGGWDGGVQG